MQRIDRSKPRGQPKLESGAFESDPNEVHRSDAFAVIGNATRRAELDLRIETRRIPGTGLVDQVLLCAEVDFSRHD
jgi:hypothetical protein